MSACLDEQGFELGAMGLPILFRGQDAVGKGSVLEKRADTFGFGGRQVDTLLRMSVGDWRCTNG